ncbi:hypothetical protein [Methylotenera sp.]|uniref:hypothetical protein n=1 Tax=Methylotenera sp. TaxID=2051956 RepID=UPI002489E5B9|nr:hypothetical protein [Methylotenera sp.]MDI1362516.1 hypothetical protein [Methylotenera sp.]
MTLTSYTTYNDIRAILGVNPKELPDADLALETYLFELETKLQEVGTDLIAKYTEAAAAVLTATETSLQKGLYRAVRLYASSSVSLSVAYSLPMRAQKSITDGKAGLDRFTGTPYKDTVDNLLNLAASYRDDLAKQYILSAGGTPATITTIPAFMGVSSPSYDPVTG